MKVLKFGGKSLQPGKPLKKAIEIISESRKEGELAIVVSALANSTDHLLSLYQKAIRFDDLTEDETAFRKLQQSESSGPDLDDLFLSLHVDLEKVKKDGPSQKLEDKVLAYGEICSARIVVQLLKNAGVDSVFVDARNLIKGKRVDDELNVDHQQSEKLTRAFFKENKEQLAVITGYIAEDEDGNTATLGRNGSNYTTSLIANYIDAEEVQNWTDVDGIYAASPKLVPEAQKIENLSYKEAHELANFGASILHPKTIGPLMEKDIPLRILNSFSDDRTGTTVSREGGKQGIKAVSVIEDVALISIEGKGLLGTIGIDARIFTALSRNNISVRLISQASSERGIGFVVDATNAQLATTVLTEEFGLELITGTISRIDYNLDMAIIAIVGRHNYSLEKAIQGLRRNRIWMHLISNSISGEHISLVIDNHDLKKAVNIVHSQVFGVIKTINLFAFGKGNVGGNLLDQIISTTEQVISRRNLRIRIVGLADSKKYIFDKTGLGQDWRQRLKDSSLKLNYAKIIEILANSALENIVIADNTSSQQVADLYPQFITKRFDIVAANKKANSGTWEEYENLHNLIHRRGRIFHYETNVGAGLPIIDTIKYLYDSADQITRIRGVFSGSLSYIFNNFSKRGDSFSAILREAKDLGLTEPDPREDLSGRDVARKLVILARELNLKVELDDIEMAQLIPDELQNEKSFNDFMGKADLLDHYFYSYKQDLKEAEVLRYVADLDVMNQQLRIQLEKVNKDSPLGTIRESDAIFEIYTDSYGERPIIVQGAGAGGAVTARGVYSDLIRMGHKF